MNQSIKENFKPTCFIIVALFLLAVSAYPQQKLGGKVVEVIDGRTLKIELFSSGTLFAELQHVEVPEADQPLHQQAAEHLRKIALGKTVDFRPLRLIKARVIGKVTIGGVDLSQQMIRDGAAWYDAEKTGQETGEVEIYRTVETQAKTEKRGVWSVAGLRPASQIRAEEANRLQQEKLAREEAAKIAYKQKMQTPYKKPQPKKFVRYSSEDELWTPSDEYKLPSGIMNVGGLLVAQSPGGELGFVGTPPMKLQVTSNKKDLDLEIGIGYLYANEKDGGHKKMFLVSVESETNDFNFLKNNELLITAGKEKISVGKAKRTARKTDGGVKEILTYEIKRDVLEKIAKAGDVSFKVGAYSGKSGTDIPALLKNMLKTL